MPNTFDESLPNIPLDLPGAAGVVTIENWTSTTPYIAVDGVRANKGMGSTYKVPMADGSTKKLKVSVTMPRHFKVKSGSEVVFTTSKADVVLIVMSVLPALLFILVQGLIGLAVIAGAAVANTLIARNESLPRGKKVLAMAGVLVAAAVVDLAILYVILTASDAI